MAGKTRALKLNPILNKELRLGSRSIKIPMFVMGYDIVLAMIAVVTMFVIQANSRYDANAFSQYLYIYQIIGWTQFAITLIIVPILTAGTISGERERQTLDIMLTTPKKPLSIIWGKMMSAISNYMIFVISSIPIMAIAFVLGGLNWFALLGYIAMMVVIAIYEGAVGMFCSATFRRTIASVVMTFLISAALLIIPYVIFFITYGIAEAIHESRMYNYAYNGGTYGSVPDLNLGILPLMLMVNPIAGFFDYMMQTMRLTSLHEIFMNTGDFGVIMPYIGYVWIPLNILFSGGVAWFFIWAASKKLNPIKKKRKKKSMVPVTPISPAMSAVEQNMTVQPAPMPQVPPMQQVSQVPPMQQVSQVPPMQQVSQVPPMQQVQQVPPMQQVQQVPPMQQVSQVPPMQQVSQVPPMQQVQQAPPMQQVQQAVTDKITNQS